MPELDTTSTYALIASMIGVLVYLLRKAPGTSFLWEKIPERWRWLVPLLLAAGAGFGEQYASGRPWYQATIGALVAGLAASGGHHALKDSPLPYGNLSVLLVGISLLGVSGCAGSLEQSRAAGANDRKFGLTAAGAGTPERCSELSDRSAFWGGGAKLGAALAGGAGLAAVPVDEPDQRDLRVGLAIGAAVAGAAAVGAQFVSESSSNAWARECSQ